MTDQAIARRIGTLFVDRQSRRSGASVLKAVDRALELGEGVAMFPEGTAHIGDQVHEFRTGAFNAARRAGAEIVPIGLAYGDEAAYYRKEPFMTHIKRVTGIRRLRVAVEIGNPLTLEKHSAVEVKDLARESVQQLVDRARQRRDEQRRSPGLHDQCLWRQPGRRQRCGLRRDRLHHDRQRRPRAGL